VKDTIKEWQMLRKDNDEENSGGIQCKLRRNPGLAITCGPNFYGLLKLPQDVLGGEIDIEEKLIPMFLHGLGKQIGSLGFLGKAVLDEIKNVKSADPEMADVKKFQKDALDNTIMAAKLWTQRCRIAMEPSSDLMRKETKNLTEFETLIKGFMATNGKPGSLKPVAYVPNALKGNIGVVVLKPKEKKQTPCLYIAQVDTSGKPNIMKLDGYLMARLVKEIVANCGTEAMVALKPLLSNTSTAVKTSKSISLT